MQSSPRKKLKLLSHLTTHRDGDFLRRALVAGAHVLHHAHDVQALDHSAEDDVLAVEVRCRRGEDEELAAVGVGAGVLEGRKKGRKSVMLMLMMTMMLWKVGRWVRCDPVKRAL